MSSALLALATIEEVIKNGNDLIQTSTSKDIIPYHCGIAPSYDKTEMSKAIKMMDDGLKIIIASTNILLSKLIQEKHVEKNQLLGWDEIISCMQNNDLLEATSSAPIDRKDNFEKEGENYFKFDGSPSQSVVNEVKSWFTNFIDDPEVLADCHIDITTLANIVAQTGATITDFTSFFYKHEHHGQQVMDVAVLRFPDIDRPYFQVYRIQLTAWSDCTRYVFVEHDANGISGVYNSRKYQPCSSAIDALSAEVKEKAIEEAENIFS